MSDENDNEDGDLIPLIEFFGCDHHFVGKIISIEVHEEGARIMLDVEDSPIWRDLWLDTDKFAELKLEEGDVVSMSVPAKGGLFVEDCDGVDIPYFTYTEDPYDIKHINKPEGVIATKPFNPHLN